MFTVEESWQMSEADQVIAIIKELGVWRLGNCDGCMCSRFSLRNVEIDIACGKGTPRGVRVSSNSMDYEDGADDLRRIGEEVARQVQESDGRSPVIGVTVTAPR